jgi:hypothetical protein
MYCTVCSLHTKCVLNLHVKSIQKLFIVTVLKPFRFHYDIMKMVNNLNYY